MNSREEFKAWMESTYKRQTANITVNGLLFVNFSIRKHKANVSTPHFCSEGLLQNLINR